MMARAIKCLAGASRDSKKMVTSQNERTSKARVVGHRYADILGTSEDGRLRIDYGRFHETLEG
jgi:hypothetical protein